MSVKAIPEGYHAVTPYLLVRDLQSQIEFLKKAFDAKVIEAVETPQGIMHAEVRIYDSMVMMGQVPPERQAMPMTLYLYVEDSDKVYEQALAAGASVIQEPKDQYYGDRSGAVKDLNENQWWIATRKENLSAEELAKKAKEKAKA